MVVFLISIFVAAPAMAARQAKDCALLLEEASSAGLSTIQSAKSEIAALLLEKSKLTNSSDVALRTLIEKNIKQKIVEFKDRFGKDIDPKEIKELVRQKENGVNVEEAEKKETENTARTKEKDAGLDWSLTPIPIKNEILSESFVLEPSNVKVVVDKGGKMRVIYQVQEAAAKERGFHIADIDTGADIYLDDRIDSAEFYKGSKGEAIITTPWAPGINDTKIEIRNSKTGKVVKEFDLPDLVPNYRSRRFLGQVQLYPYEKPNGDMSVLFTWSTGLNEPDAVFDLNPKTGNIKDVGEIEDDNRIYRSADYKRIYTYSLSEPNIISKKDVRKKLVVSDLLGKKVIFEKELTFNEKVHADMFKTREVAFFESSKGNPYLAVSYYSSDETNIYDIFGKKSQTYKRNPDHGSGGTFAEGDGGSLYFISSLNSDNGQQIVIDLKTKKVETRKLGKFLGIDLSAVSNVDRYGAVAFYDAQIGGSFSPGQKRFLVVLPLAQLGVGGSAVDITKFDTGSLLDTYKDKEGRVFGVFRNSGRNSKGGQSEKNNFVLVQLYGPRRATP